jgi:hypothetical protein
MAQDVVALGLYQQAEDKMESAFSKRRERAGALQFLASMVATNRQVMGGVVTRFDVKQAQNILAEMARLEEEIASALKVVNANAPKCGKPTLRLSD